jgi:hypothetical protein
MKADAFKTADKLYFPFVCIHTYIHYMDPKSVKKTVGCGISHTISGTHIQYNRSYSILHAHTHINIDNAVNLHYVHKPLRG